MALDRYSKTDMTGAVVDRHVVPTFLSGRPVYPKTPSNLRAEFRDGLPDTNETVVYRMTERQAATLGVEEWSLRLLPGLFVIYDRHTYVRSNWVATPKSDERDNQAGYSPMVLAVSMWGEEYVAPF